MHPFPHHAIPRCRIKPQHFVPYCTAVSVRAWGAQGPGEAFYDETHCLRFTQRSAACLQGGFPMAVARVREGIPAVRLRINFVTSTHLSLSVMTAFAMVLSCVLDCAMLKRRKHVTVLLHWYVHLLHIVIFHPILSVRPLSLMRGQSSERLYPLASMKTLSVPFTHDALSSGIKPKPHLNPTSECRAASPRASIHSRAPFPQRYSFLVSWLQRSA